jgi:Molybdopterin cofactor-binding domain
MMMVMIGQGIPLAPSSPKFESTQTPARSESQGCSVFFSVGRVINPVTARSPFIGGMTMGIGMALHERGVMDPASAPP